MRRANSMSNLLEEDNVDIDEVDERNAHGHNNSASGTNTSSISDSKVNLNGSTSTPYRGSAHHNHHYYNHNLDYNGKLLTNQNIPNGKFKNGGSFPEELATDDASSSITTTSSTSSTSKMSNGNSQRCRPRALQRGNDSLKRARSVEALMRYDTLAWRRDVEESEDYPSSNPIILDEIIVSDYQSTVIKAKTADSITIEDKIQQARDRMSDPKPPRRLTSLMSDSERPPPDLVKQTLLKFEATANRRARATSIQRYGHGDVAAKIEKFKKSKLTQDKTMIPVSPPIQITSKLPPSGFQMAAATTSVTAKKPIIKPRTTSPKAGAQLPFFNGTKMEQINQSAMSPLPLAKKTVTIHNKSHDTNENHDTTDHHPHNYQQQHSSLCNGNSLKSIDVERMNQKNAANTIRIDTYRNNKYNEMISPDSSTVISPTNSDSPRSSNYVYDMVRRRETNHMDSPLITQLAKKTENIHLTTPKNQKSHKMLADVVASYNNSVDDSSVQPASSDNDDECDDGTSSETGWSESYDVNSSDNENGGEQFLTKKPPVPRSKQNGSGGSSQIKATVINVTPIQAIGAFDKSVKSVDHQPEPSVRQIGIIRPLNHAETAGVKQHPIPIARKSQQQSSPTSSTTTNSSTKKDSTDAIKVNVTSAPIVVSTQHSLMLPSSTSSVVVTNSVSVATSNDCQGGTDVVVIECTGDSNIETTKSMSSPPIPTTPPPTTNNRTKLMTNNESNTISIDTRSIVHQKNLLNKEKSEELFNGSNGSSCSSSSPPTLMIQSPIKWNIKKSTVVSSSPVAPAASSPTTLVVNQSTASSSPQIHPSPANSGGSKQRPNDIHTTNTMVFNFSNRKDVPDYIENDGLVIRRKRELPKVSVRIFISLICVAISFRSFKSRSSTSMENNNWIVSKSHVKHHILFIHCSQHQHIEIKIHTLLRSLLWDFFLFVFHSMELISFLFVFEDL